jgi:acyl-CoA synthetase (AMP-forming)/AMP-acid ligase II
MLWRLLMQLLHERAQLLGNYLRLRGLVAGDRVGVLLPNVAEVLGTPAHLLSYFSCMNPCCSFCHIRSKRSIRSERIHSKC